MLFLAALIGGALNSVAGGGSFVVFPALLFAGAPPIVANATTAAGLLPASAASAFAYRKDFAYDKLFATLALASFFGGAAGAAVLLVTRESTFTIVLPLLLAFAAAVFTFGGRVAKAFRERTRGPRGLLVAFAIELVIATYGGYFGGGMGILMLATFALVGLDDIHAMNGIKSSLAVVINGTAVVAFALAHKIHASFFLVTAAGGIVGGYAGARVARRVSAARVRVAVIVYAWLMTAYFAFRTYR